MNRYRVGRISPGQEAYSGKRDYSSPWNCCRWGVTDCCTFRGEVQLHIVSIQLVEDTSAINVVNLFFFPKLCVLLYRDIQNPKYFRFFSDVIIALFFLEAKRSQSISNCVHLCEALPATKSVPLLLHTVSSLLPGISYTSCSHRLSGTVP